MAVGGGVGRRGEGQRAVEQVRRAAEWARQAGVGATFAAAVGREAVFGQQVGVGDPVLRVDERARRGQPDGGVRAGDGASWAANISRVTAGSSASRCVMVCEPMSCGVRVDRMASISQRP